MARIHRNANWIIGLFGIACIAISAASIAQRGEPRHQATALDARQLSSVFRNVSKSALPSIVSIETVGKPTRNTIGELDSNPLLREFFGNDPRLRDMFREQQLRPSKGLGSGFIISDDGLIMTNNHVVKDAAEVHVRLHDGREFIATDIRTDPRTDVAIIRIEADNLRPIRLGNSDGVEIGDWVLAVGSPFGLDLSVTAGIISAKGRGPGITKREDFLQTDAAINPGNSGGPLLNLDGEVIGINTAISSRGGGNDGIGFTIPINMAQWVSRQLIDHGTVQRAYLGVSIQPVDHELADQFGVKIGEGAIVATILPESPAGKSGLKEGDVILDLAGTKVTGPRNLQGIVERLEIGKKYNATVLRDGRKMNLSIGVEAMPEQFASSGSREVRQPQEDRTESVELGFQVQSASAEQLEQLGFSGRSGVIVTSVKSGSPAANAGIRPGNLIERVGADRVSNAAEFEKALTNVSLEKGVLLLVRGQQGTSRFVVLKAR